MDTWLIVLIALTAIALIAVVVVGGKKGKGKREGGKQEVRDRRLKAEQERIAGEKHRARAEVSEELAAERASAAGSRPSCTSAGRARSIRTATDNGWGFARAQEGKWQSEDHRAVRRGSRAPDAPTAKLDGR